MTTTKANAKKIRQLQTAITARRKAGFDWTDPQLQAWNEEITKLAGE